MCNSFQKLLGAFAKQADDRKWNGSIFDQTTPISNTVVGEVGHENIRLLCQSSALSIGDLIE